jgi:hypothetical protein
MQTTALKSRGRLWAWGTGIVYCVFAAATIGFVVFASTQKVELVSEDYYKNEVAYHEQIERINRTNALKESLEWKIGSEGKTLDFYFASHAISGGTITFYRPSTSSMDKKYTIAIDKQGMQSLPLEGLSKGMWRIKVEWSENDKTFYKEADLIL